MGKASLLLVMGISAIMSKMLLSSNEQIIALSATVSEYYEGKIARNIAHSSANIAAAKLFRDSNWRAGLNTTNFNGGSFFVTVVDTFINPDSLIKVIATGSFGGIQKTVQTMMKPYESWPYAMYSDIDIDLDNGSGTISGNVHSNGTLDINGGYTVNGTVTHGFPNINSPTVDSTFFKNKAIAAGQYVNGNYTFTPAGSPYTDVWYITGDADIQGGTVINGTLYVGNRCEFIGANINITTASPNYPALVVGERARGDQPSYDNINITGLIYCGEKWETKGDNITLTGALITLDRIRNEGTNFVLTHDEIYTGDVAGVTFESDSTKMKILSWYVD